MGGGLVRRPAALGLPLHLNGGGHQVRDLVHVDDIADGTLHALSCAAADRETLDIGTGRPTTIRRVADPIAAHYPNAQVRETPMPPGTRSAAAPAPPTWNAS